jgi:hypothetical protein
LRVCVPQVAMYKDLLPQSSCDADQRCAPCINPLTGMPSGACDIGESCASSDGGAPAAPMCPHVGPPVVDPAKFPSCDPSGHAHCMPASLAPANVASQLAACPTGVCAPDDFIAAGGNFIPKSCHSLASAEGRCLHVAIPKVAKQQSMLPTDVCAPDERCVPCYSPVDGKSTDACTLSCDPGPTQPPVQFADCCNKGPSNATEGKCVPESAIPQSLQKNLGADTCEGKMELCVPTENLNPDWQPMTCSAFNLLGRYNGVCLSICLSLGFQQLGVSRGSCDGLHQCVPCVFAGKPTGAPGCAPTP